VRQGEQETKATKESVSFFDEAKHFHGKGPNEKYIKIK
jgi:hypothetical protein